MAKRDPAKTARNKMIAALKDQLRALLPTVLKETGLKDESSLNAMIGGKAAEFIDLHHAVILSSDAYTNLYLKGFRGSLSAPGPFANAHRRNYELIKSSPAGKQYVSIFLRRAYLNHFEELSRTRPHLNESEIWLGQNNADYGLLITPRYINGVWENDKSEIRHFPKAYWTIGHVLETGLVVDGDPDKIEFPTIDAYLTFFKNSLVRASGSIHEKKIAQLYVDYVRASDKPESVPLLIPEYRYEGKAKKHIYRLDFTIINPFTMDKVGFELSPWSTHGEMTGLKGKNQSEINQIAKANFEKEMKKHRSFFEKHGIYALIYTDEQLSDIASLFDKMRQYLNPSNKTEQLDLDLMNNFFDE